ncbi:MAG: helix-turn-helix domain-containing protein [Desulfobacteraceae bacterium]|nr:helix-turn-helix domain-containing protein [Desulfobacteraceae bacterium]
MEGQKLTLTIWETSRLLGISRAKTYEAARTGQLPVLKFGRRLVVSRYALEKMLKEAKPNTTQNDCDSR